MSVFVLGGAQTDFARNWGRGEAISSMLSEVISAAMDDARIDPLDIDVSHVGNFVGKLFCGQGHLGAMLAAVEPALAGKPASRHEAACASGSMALLSAMAELEAGRYDIALVAIGLHYRNGGDQRGGRNGCGHSLREGLSRVVELALAPTPADRSKPSKPARG